VACKRFTFYSRIYISNRSSFALLGPSGCGKTTLIRTLVGRLHPVNNHDGTQGTIYILGKHPHAFGQLVGFMPQEMALHTTNTIDEELFFYGRLANMPKQKIQQRCQFLTNLLELSNRRKIISKLSGGQQRRVSFAIALLHEPKLLILGMIFTRFCFPRIYSDV
jgi:ABC-type multidrug transport system ATPase subunit